MKVIDLRIQLYYRVKDSDGAVLDCIQMTF